MDLRKCILLNSQVARGDERIASMHFKKDVAVLQLNPPIPMNTPKGEGFADILIDYIPNPIFTGRY